MKVVCIRDTNKSTDLFYEGYKITYTGITIGKQYNTLSWSSTMFKTSYTIINDYGNRESYRSDLFISIEEHRDNKIKELGL